MKRFLCLSIIVCIFLSCAGCQTQYQETFFAMDTVVQVQVWGRDGQEAVRQFKSLMQNMEDVWSAVDETSVLSAYNRAEVELTQSQKTFLDQVQQLSKRTDGAFDPLLGGIVALWGFYDDDYKIPESAAIQNAPRLWDLGAVVKGYAGQLAVDMLESMQVERAVLNIGGNIQTYGNKTDNTPWQIGIQNPAGGDPVGVISVMGTASIVTSGDYQRYFEEDGVRYHHIIDPETGFPADSGLSSVTVVCRDGMTADALSTALFVMGLEEAVEFWRKSDDFEAVFILKSGQIYATQGVCLTDCAFEVIPRED